MRNPLHRLKSHYERNTVVRVLLTFHKRGPMSLIEYLYGVVQLCSGKYMKLIEVLVEKKGYG
jgi:hypothetical protein